MVSSCSLCSAQWPQMCTHLSLKLISKMDKFSSSRNNLDKEDTNQLVLVIMYLMQGQMQHSHPWHLINLMQGQCYQVLNRTYKESRVLSNYLYSNQMTRQLIRMVKNLNRETQAWRQKCTTISKLLKKRCRPVNYTKVPAIFHQDNHPLHDVKLVLNQPAMLQN